MTRFIEKQPLTLIWFRNKQDFSTILSGENREHLSCSEQDLLCKRVTLSMSLTPTHWFWSLFQSFSRQSRFPADCRVPLQLCSWVCQEVICSVAKQRWPWAIWPSH